MKMRNLLVSCIVVSSWIASISGMDDGNIWHPSSEGGAGQQTNSTSGVNQGAFYQQIKEQIEHKRGTGVPIKDGVPLVSDAERAQAVKHWEHMFSEGGDPNTQDAVSGATILMQSATGDCPIVSLVELLLAHNADPNLTNHENKTVLFRVVHELSQDVFTFMCAQEHLNDSEISESLLSKMAVRRDVIDVLLSRGANPSIRDGSGQNAIDIAQENGLDDVVQLLQQHQPQ